MKCPRCGNEMKIDEHRKYSMYMCYDCGYMEGRDMGSVFKPNLTNFEKLRSMNENEAIAFLAKGMHINSTKLTNWMAESAM